jgi:hypothetical protein
MTPEVLRNFARKMRRADIVKDGSRPAGCGNPESLFPAGFQFRPMLAARIADMGFQIELGNARFKVGNFEHPRQKMHVVPVRQRPELQASARNICRCRIFSFFQDDVPSSTSGIAEII